MSQYEETLGAPGASNLEPDDGRVREATAAAPETERDVTELRRSLLIYGTAGQVGRVRVEMRTI